MYQRAIFKLHANTKAVSGNSSSSSRFGKLEADDQINKFSIKQPHIAIKQKWRHSVQYTIITIAMCISKDSGKSVVENS